MSNGRGGPSYINVAFGRVLKAKMVPGQEILGFMDVTNIFQLILGLYTINLNTINIKLFRAMR